MKRALLISGLIATAMTAFGAAGITSGELDLPGLNQRIDSIDARTTDNEQDIQKLQEATQTAPAEHVAVPVVQPTTVSQPNSVTAQEPAPTVPPTPTPMPTPCPTPMVTNAPGTSIVVIGGCQ
ncbi:hypothetical protein [Arthrobacter sp. 9MFCol3.1]|uniref:hypothetical protein n=1 Tax=Arthrobacter sp. 9MFCol3.1 TaxID=1150398 RepID=UPI00047E6FBF|nr:hypothetical protein [Arthrobacter sp. 9MFCol3.1]